MMFLYLLPTGMNDPNQPTWGSWAGRHGPHDEHSAKPYYWASQIDTWQGTTSRDNILARWAAHLQNDFRARMDWCVADAFAKANHRPIAVLNGDQSTQLLELSAASGQVVNLSAAQSHDPDGHAFKTTWFIYSEPGTYRGNLALSATEGKNTSFTVPTIQTPQTVHVVLQLEDDGQPPLVAYRRAIITMRP